MELPKQEQKWTPRGDRNNIDFAQEAHGAQISAWLYPQHPHLQLQSNYLGLKSYYRWPRFPTAAMVQRGAWGGRCPGGAKGSTKQMLREDPVSAASREMRGPHPAWTGRWPKANQTYRSAQPWNGGWKFKYKMENPLNACRQAVKTVKTVGIVNLRITPWKCAVVDN